MTRANPGSPLLLGPLLRHVGETDATVWVQTADTARVTVRCGGGSWSADTFAVHGFHYALVVVEGLEPGTVHPYTVEVGDTAVWPPAESAFPPSRIATLRRSKPARLAFGSCRTSSPHDQQGNRMHGVDALRAYAVRMAEDDEDGWPDLCVFLGDQVYADRQICPQMLDFIRSRRDTSQPPGEEIKDYVEYDYLYRLAWTDPAVRWILSTVPSTMIFDDHDVRDDWNTSWSWRREIRQKPWWQTRIVAALASYWVYQHLGNLGPKSLAEDEIWTQVLAHEGGPELDLTDVLDAFAARADEHPETYRWSFTRDLGESQLVVVDSRAARKLDPKHRSMLDDDEMAWFDARLRGDCQYLFIGTSLPFLLPPGLHHFEALDEAIAQGAWGQRPARAAERVRRALDLEHWAAFNDSFVDVFESVMAVARGQRGTAPKVITFLSGDVHNSYLAEVSDPGRYGATSRIVQAVCSPMRNPMPRSVRVLMSLFAKGLAKPMRAIAGGSSKVPDPAYPWTVTEGPWFDNNLAVCQVEGDGLSFRWYAGEVVDGDLERPRTKVVADITIG
ncbi:MAG: alkaline phosphatase D family protein [Candidatus Phosphoribacter sp.]